MSESEGTTNTKEVEGNESSTQADKKEAATPDEEKQRAWMKAFVEEEKKLDAGHFIREFARIRMTQEILRQDDKYASTTAGLPSHFGRNRYRDILPYDTNRVQLKNCSEENGEGYVNASHVSLPSGLTSFIAAQAPLPSTLDEFWQLIEEQGVRMIVMLCKLIEMSKVKCERYWPENVGETVIYGAYEVKLEEEEKLHDDEYLVRRFTLKREDGVNRTIHQLHYREWPDHGCPTGPNQLLDMIDKMASLETTSEEEWKKSGDACTPPVVVHCSAGVGRTGTIILINHIRELIKQNCCYDIKLVDLVISLRKQRSSMVQTQDQFQFVHRCVSLYCRKALGLPDEDPLPSPPPTQTQNGYPTAPISRESESEEDGEPVPDFPCETRAPRGPEDVNS